MAVTDEAIDKIKYMIARGELRPGDRLPKEADLAERLGLSRNSLREAVKALTLIRVLDVRQGDGTYVTSLEPALLLGAMNFVVDFHRDDTVLEFVEVRRILEPAATALAAERMTDEEISHLGATLDELGDCPATDALVAHDLRFHRLIVAGAHNRALAALADNLAGPATRARIWHALREPAIATAREQHRAIFEAIAARQPELARSWAAVHVAGAEAWLRRALETGDG